ncbi:MAG: YchJ family protein [Azoarcus sp.]|nr:YchJ family protein [Azoarcus sp.]
MPEPCPCGRGATLAGCCARLHAGEPAADADAEALMRSRYSAFVLGDATYLLATWHASTRPETLDLDQGERPKWLGLEVRRAQLASPDTAVVEFIARYRIAGRTHRLHETSRFVREDGRWYYVDGELDGNQG